MYIFLVLIIILFIILVLMFLNNRDQDRYKLINVDAQDVHSEYIQAIINSAIDNIDNNDVKYQLTEYFNVQNQIHDLLVDKLTKKPTTCLGKKNIKDLTKVSFKPFIYKYLFSMVVVDTLMEYKFIKYDFSNVKHILELFDFIKFNKDVKYGFYTKMQEDTWLLVRRVGKFNLNEFIQNKKLNYINDISNQVIADVFKLIINKQLNNKHVF